MTWVRSGALLWFEGCCGLILDLNNVDWGLEQFDFRLERFFCRLGYESLKLRSFEDLDLTIQRHFEKNWNFFEEALKIQRRFEELWIPLEKLFCTYVFGLSFKVWCKSSFELCLEIWNEPYLWGIIFGVIFREIWNDTFG